MFDPTLPREAAADDADRRTRSALKAGPSDLRQQRFRTEFRGFDRVEVGAFINAVADDFEHALKETDRLHQDLARMEAVLGVHREHAWNLRSTQTTTEKLADAIKRHADQDAGRLIREAGGRADLLLDQLSTRLEDIQRNMDALRLRRTDVQTSIEATIQALRGTVADVKRHEMQEREDKILRHRPRQTGPAGDDRL
jgi:cell division initiation protein